MANYYMHCHHISVIFFFFVLMDLNAECRRTINYFWLLKNIRAWMFREMDPKQQFLISINRKHKLTQLMVQLELNRFLVHWKQLANQTFEMCLNSLKLWMIKYWSTSISPQYISAMHQRTLQVGRGHQLSWDIFSPLIAHAPNNCKYQSSITAAM